MHSNWCSWKSVAVPISIDISYNGNLYHPNISFSEVVVLLSDWEVLLIDWRRGHNGEESGLWSHTSSLLEKFSITQVSWQKNELETNAICIRMTSERIRIHLFFILCVTKSYNCIIDTWFFSCITNNDEVPANRPISSTKYRTEEQHYHHCLIKSPAVKFRFWSKFRTSLMMTWKPFEANHVKFSYKVAYNKKLVILINLVKSKTGLVESLNPLLTSFATFGIIPWNCQQVSVSITMVIDIPHEYRLV